MTKVAAAIIKSGESVLIAQRKKTDQVPLKWEFPGGKIEEGESPEECLKREIKEELNIDISVHKYFGSSTYAYEHGTIELLAYFASYDFNQEIKLLSHAAVKWVEIAALDMFDFAPADIPIVNKLKNKY